jgi:hypothetical protein
MSEEQAPTEASFSLETLTHALELLGDMPQLRLDSPVFLWSASPHKLRVAKLKV